jgi:hypothetical protein
MTIVSKVNGLLHRFRTRVGTTTRKLRQALADPKDVQSDKKTKVRDESVFQPRKY